MKMYALFDTVRNKYFRMVYDGRESFTVKPYEMTCDKGRLEDHAKRYMKKSNWKMYNMQGEVPKLVVRVFEVDTKF